jgi:hypothetical protein
VRQPGVHQPAAHAPAAAGRRLRRRRRPRLRGAFSGSDACTTRRCVRTRGRRGSHTACGCAATVASPRLQHHGSVTSERTRRAAAPPRTGCRSLSGSFS